MFVWRQFALCAREVSDFVGGVLCERLHLAGAATRACSRRSLLRGAMLVLVFGLGAFMAAAEESPSAEAITGQYVMGGGASRMVLVLAEGGAFVMTSPSHFGTEGEVSGQWSLYESQLVLRTLSPGRKFRWVLETFPRGDRFDLVPEETLEAYKENPQSSGTRYRRVANAPPLRPATVASKGSSGVDAPGAMVRRESIPQRREVIGVDRSPGPARRPAAQPVARIAKASDLKMFAYMPTLAEPPDLRALRGPGLARLSFDARGKVTSVAILQSTGNHAFDADAADALRKWRAKPGGAAAVELPLTTVTSGKRTPVRVPTSGGSMTSG